MSFLSARLSPTGLTILAPHLDQHVISFCEQAKDICDRLANSFRQRFSFFFQQIDDDALHWSDSMSRHCIPTQDDITALQQQARAMIMLSLQQLISHLHALTIQDNEASLLGAQMNNFVLDVCACRNTHVLHESLRYKLEIPFGTRFPDAYMSDRKKSVTSLQLDADISKACRQCGVMREILIDYFKDENCNRIALMRIIFPVFQVMKTMGYTAADFR